MRKGRIWDGVLVSVSSGYWGWGDISVWGPRTSLTLIDENVLGLTHLPRFAPLLW